MAHSRYPKAIEKALEKALEKEGKQSHAYSENSPGVCGRTASVDEASISFLDTIRLYTPQCNRTGKKTGRAIPAARSSFRNRFGGNRLDAECTRAALVFKEVRQNLITSDAGGSIPVHRGPEDYFWEF
jgi:hypothetical protein